MDDREDVWANALENEVAGRRRGEPPLNLVLIKPYHYDKFRGYAEVNNSSGEDLTISLKTRVNDHESSKTEDDDHLLLVKDILIRLHHRFFLYHVKDTGQLPQEINVSSILEQMRKEVLRGCNMVLSGLIPVVDQYKASSMAEARPQLLRYVNDLGAMVR